jgi:pimeloyl-ACP methyl ester carboxylesterase
MLEVLLIPGNMCDDRLWQPVSVRLETAGYSVRNAPVLNQRSIGDMAQNVQAGINHPIIAVGFSMGAIVAVELARSFPGLVAGLGLVAFNASGDLPDRAAVRPAQQQAVRQGMLERIVKDELKPNYLAQANRTDSALLQTVMQMAQALGPDTFIKQSEALRLRDDLRPSLSNLRVPVMLACGSEDRLCPPEWHRRWAKMIGPNAMVDEIAGAGHLVPLEQPQALASSLLGWLAKEFECQTAS